MARRCAIRCGVCRLWRGYEPTVDSPIADITNTPNYNLAGAITAGLFLNRFVTESPRWMHLDIPGWNDRARPGRKTARRSTRRARLYALFAERYGKKTKKTR